MCPPYYNCLFSKTLTVKSMEEEAIDCVKLVQEYPNFDKNDRRKQRN